MYADDDSQLCISVLACDAVDAVERLSVCWLSGWLHIDSNSTQQKWILCGVQPSDATTKLSLMFAKVTISPLREVRDLGIVLDSKLA